MINKIKNILIDNGFEILLGICLAIIIIYQHSILNFLNNFVGNPSISISFIRRITYHLIILINYFSALLLFILCGFTLILKIILIFFFFINGLCIFCIFWAFIYLSLYCLALVLNVLILLNISFSFFQRELSRAF